MSETLDFESAYNELQEINSELENTDIGLHVLVEKVKRAAVLIKLCKTELKSAETEIGSVINDVSAIVEETPTETVTESKPPKIKSSDDDLPF